MNIFGGNNKNALTDFKDPFNKDYVDCITFWIKKDLFDKSKITYSANVYFENGKTKGEQKIEAKDFVELVKKVEDFVQTLK